jgi:RHS repeat-associated protein
MEGSCPELKQNLYARKGSADAQHFVDPNAMKEKSGCDGKAASGNPCNPLTGNKYQIENDTAGDGANALRFTRYYNSLPTGGNQQPGRYWQHSYSASLTPEYQYMLGDHDPDSGASSLHTTRQAACEQGWNEIKANVTRFDAALLTAVWEGEFCQLYNGQTRVATLPVYTDNSNLGGINGGVGTLVAYTANRPNGSTLRFVQTGAGWHVTPPGPYTVTVVQEGLQLTDADNNVETYSTSGQLLSIADANGNTTTLTYGAGGQVSRVENTRGEYFDFTYVNGQLTTLTDHASRSWTYGHDGNQNLISVRNPDGTDKQYHYEDPNFPHALTGITDENGVRYGTYAYDPQGRAKSSEHIGGVDKVTFAYPDDTTRVITNSRGYDSTYTLTTQSGIRLPTSFTGPGCSTCGPTNTSYEYNSDNQLTARTKDGVTTQYSGHDGFGNVGTMTEAVGTPEQGQTTYTYDPRFINKVANITEPSVYASGNKITTYTYDDFANVTDITVTGFTPTGTPVTRTIGLAYAGPLGQLSLIDGPRTDVTDHYTLDYYPNDAALGPNRARLQRVTDPNGLVLRDNIQYSATGKVFSEQRPNNLTLNYTYFAGNDRLKQIDQINGTGTRALHFTWLPSGELKTITQGYGSPDAVTLTLGYDAARRLTSITDGLGNVVEYVLDTEGNREATNIKDATGTLKRSLTQTFDAYNKLDVFSQANETADYSMAPDGTVDQLTDGNGHVSDFDYDALKRLIARTDDLGGTDVTTKDALSQFDYNVHDDLTQVTDPNGNATSYAYDDLGNLLSRTSPDTGTTQFGYDAAGNVSQRTDAKGQVLAYSYDAANRLMFIDAPGTAEDVTFTYDNCDHGNGRLCAVTTGTGSTVNYTYTAFGDVTAHQGVGYAYTATGQVGTMWYPSGRSVTYSYDAAGQVNGVTTTDGTTSQTLASTITYEPFGPVNALNYGNGLSLAQALDTAYRLTQQRVTGVFERDYSAYDGNGNLGQITDVLSTASDVFTYDALNRVDIAVGGFGNQDFAYDKNGNRTALTDSGSVLNYGYEAGSNRLATAANDNVILDANGNTSSKGTWTYTHNVNNRLVAANDSGTPVASYVYNALGQRISKNVGGSTTQFIYGLNGELLAELDGSGTVLREYVYLNGAPLAVIDASGIHYIHTDHLGSPRAVSDATGTLVWNWNSDPFGQAAANDDPDGDGTAFTLNLRFPGQYYDAETGLHYNYFRDYDPSTGRYVQSDPIGLAGGLNTYGYVGGNPIRYFDLFGLHHGRPHGQMGHGPVSDNGPTTSIGTQIGSTVFQHGDGGPNWSHTSAIGVGIFVEVCSKPDPGCNEDDKDDDAPWFLFWGSDSLSAGMRTIGVSFNKDGTACVALGPGFGIPFGWSWDTPPDMFHKKK